MGIGPGLEIGSMASAHTVPARFSRKTEAGPPLPSGNLSDRTPPPHALCRGGGGFPGGLSPIEPRWNFLPAVESALPGKDLLVTWRAGSSLLLSGGAATLQIATATVVLPAHFAAGSPLPDPRHRGNPSWHPACMEKRQPIQFMDGTNQQLQLKGTRFSM